MQFNRPVNTHETSIRRDRCPVKQPERSRTKVRWNATGSDTSENARAKITAKVYNKVTWHKVEETLKRRLRLAKEPGGEYLPR